VYLLIVDDASELQASALL